MEEEADLRRELEEEVCVRREEWEEGNEERVAKYRAQLAEWRVYQKARVRSVCVCVCVCVCVSYDQVYNHPSKYRQHIYHT